MARTETPVPATAKPSGSSGSSGDRPAARAIEHYHLLTPGQQKVAAFLVDHPAEAKILSTRGLAWRAGTSAATVVRLARALGYGGWSELRHEMTDLSPGRRNVLGPVQSRVPGESSPRPVRSEFETCVAEDQVNLDETLSKFTLDEIEGAVSRIRDAERTVLCGTDQMAFFASYLRHLLMLLDIRCEVVASPSEEGLERLGRIDEKTLLIGFSAGHPHPLVTRAMSLARQRGGATVAISDDTLSEMTTLAEHRLYYSSNSPAYVRSHTALLSVVQALAYGVYARDEAAFEERVKAFRLK